VTTIQLIVNADDFGASEEVNEAVIRGFRQGVLTSCSLMVSGQAFEHAVGLAKENPRLAVGIHLMVVAGRSVLSTAEIPHLIDPRGKFPDSPVAAGLKYYFLRRARPELQKELTAQFEKFQASGLPCSHIDGHLHLHVHPVVFDLAVQLGKCYGVRCLRVPLDDLSLALRFDSRRSIQKRLYGVVFYWLCGRMRPRLVKEGFLSTERVYGFFQTGRMSAPYFLRVLENLKSESNEIYFHPACYQDDQLLSDEQRQGFVEYEALISEQVTRRIQQLGIRLTTYRDLHLTI
jgi:hopanoid biosynthesis associated protein HpnK